MSVLLQLEQLAVAYGQRPAVRGVSLTVQRGESYGLVGESGSGKSTVALAIANYLPESGHVTDGRILIDGQDVLRMAERDLRALRGRRLAMVYQDPAGALNPSIRVGEQIAEIHRLHFGASREQAKARAIEALARVQIPDAALAIDRYPHQFSGGQQQRIVIAMALAGEPDLLILDEPTTGLDATVEAEILDLFEELRRVSSAAMLYISHDVTVVARMCERVGVMRDGELVESGATKDVLTTPSHPYTRALLSALVPFGRSKSNQGAPTGEPWLEVEDLHKDYAVTGGRLTALHETSLGVARGETLGIIGESGSGKTTLARLIAGLIAPTRGTMRLDGKALAGTVEQRTSEQIRAVQMVFQNPDLTLNPRRRIGTMLLRTVKRLGRRRGAAARQRVDELLRAVRLEPRLGSALPDELSGGQRQRVAIARAFAGAPQLVICDEPTSALDLSIRADVIELLADLQRSAGTSYLFISHDLPTVRYLADRVAVMYLGEILAIGPAADLFVRPMHPYTESLMAAMRDLREPRRAGLKRARGPVPSPLDRPSGCPFHQRCPRKVGPQCEEDPPWQTVASGHAYRCVIGPTELQRLQQTQATPTPR